MQNESITNAGFRALVADALALAPEDWGRREARVPLRPARFSSKVYYMDSHGSIRRRVPKRDRSMSARQWKRAVKAQRRRIKLEVSR